MQKKIAIFSGTRVGAYCIRPKNDHDNGRMNEKMGVLKFIFIRGIENRVRIGPRFVRGMDFWVGMGFIRPLTWPLVGRIQYAPTLTDEILSIFLPIRPLVWPCRGVCNTPLHGRPKKWRFFYPFDHRCGRLWGVCCCALHGQTKTGLVFGSYFEGGRKRGRGVGCAKSGVGALP